MAAAFRRHGPHWVIIILTYVVGICHFSHVIVGSIEVFALAAQDGTSWRQALGDFTAPALLGNILGGVLLVAGLNHAQVVANEAGDKIEKE